MKSLPILGGAPIAAGPIGEFSLGTATGTQTLTPGLYTNAQTFFAATVTSSKTLTPARYDNTQTFYAATVTQGGAPQSLTPSLYTNGQTFYSASVTTSNTLAPSLYTNAQTFYGPTLATSNTLAPSLYSNAQTFYGATVTASKTLTPALYTNTQTFYSAVISQAGGPQTLVPDLYTNAQAFYSPTVTAGAINLSPALYSNTQDFYAPAVTTDNTLAPALFTNAQTFYAAVVSNGATTQELTFEDYVDPGYVEPGYVTWAAGFQGGNQFFGPTLEQFALRGEGWLEYPAKKTRSRSFRREREDRENLRATIERAINPIVATQAKVVTVGDKVAVLTNEGPAAAIPVPPAFDAKAVSVMVASMLEKAGIEAQRVRDAAAKRQAEALMERIRDEYTKRLIKKRRQEELLLLA